MPAKLQVFTATEEQFKDGAYPSHAMLLAKSDEAFGAFNSDERWGPVAPAASQVWTDDYANVLGARK